MPGFDGLRRSGRSRRSVGNLIEWRPIVLPLPTLIDRATIIVIPRVREAVSVAVRSVRPRRMPESGPEEKRG